MSGVNAKLNRVSSGLVIEWMLKDTKFFLHLSNCATKGIIFPTSIPPKFLSSLFHTCNPKTSASCIVACDSGEVIIVSFKKSDLKKVCQTQGNVIWADFLNDCFCVLERCGKLSLGRLNSNPNEDCAGLLQWVSIMLPLMPICCTALDHHLVLSDGFSSYLYEVDEKKKDLSPDVRKISVCGVVRVEKQGEKVRLFTCDGRQYWRTLAVLKQEGVKDSQSQNGASFYVENLELSQVMDSMKLLHELTKKETIVRNKVDLYLEQISVAQTLLASVCAKDLFSTKLEVSSAGVDGGYLLFIELTQVLTDIKFEGPWWQLNVKLKGCDNLNCVSSDVETLSHAGLGRAIQINLTVPFHVVDNLILEYDKILNIEFDLLFLHFSCQKTLCGLKVHRHTLDALYFLTSLRNAVLPPLLSSQFVTKVSRMFEAFSECKVKEDFSHFHRTFLVLSEKSYSILDAIFPGRVPPTPGSPLTVTKWLQNISISMSCEKIDTKYKVTIEGSSRPVIVAVKASIERRAMHVCEQGLAKERIGLKLSKELERKAHLAKVILDLETSNGKVSEHTVKSVYESVSNLLSSVPL